MSKPPVFITPLFKHPAVVEPIVAYVATHRLRRLIHYRQRFLYQKLAEAYRQYVPKAGNFLPPTSALRSFHRVQFPQTKLDSHL